VNPVTCPFGPCIFEFTPVREADGTRRIPLHDTRAMMPFGQCPASLMQIPLSDLAHAHLVDQARAYRRMRDRAREEHGDPPVPPPATEVPLRPLGTPRWFTPQDPDPGRPGLNVHRPGHLRPDDLDPRRLPGQPGRPVHGRTPVDSHMDAARSANSAAIAACQEVTAMLQVAKERLGEVVGLFAQAHAGSGQTAAQEAAGLAGAAMEGIDDPMRTVLAAIEQANQVIF
jgi:hypothetical protein